MIIEDPEGFKTWLTARLEPLCDADPAALAKYVYALVKKDKPVDDLKASMIDQLEVFLQKETHGFVELLFRTLGTQVYDNPSNSPEVVITSPTQVVPAPPIVLTAVASPKISIDVDLRETVPPPTVEDTDRKLNTKENDKEERNRRGRRRGSSASPDRRRSRSRSYERRRSRSRDRDRARAWRNKSPPPRRYERRRSYSKSPVRRHSRSRTPSKRTFPAGGRYRNRSPPHSRSRSRSRTRSHSRSPLGGRERKDVTVGSPREGVHGDTDLRLSVVSSIQSVVAVPTDIPNYTPRRCRDFDEKGYCMRGDHCPYDHGSDPVIVDGMPSIMYNGSAPTQPPIPLAPPGHANVEPIHHQLPPIQRLAVPPPPITTNLSEYNPDAPSMEPRSWGRPQYRGSNAMRGMSRGGAMGRGGFIPHQRELINVVTGGGPPYRNPRPHTELNDTMRPNLEVGKRSGFDFNRLGNNRPPRLPLNTTSTNTSLQLKKVPPGVNNITHLNNHFSKFGKILNIQVGFEGDLESALITFSTHTEANIAYKSTEAVLNNRFIRVYWYNPNNNNNNTNNNNNSINNESKQENLPPSSRPSVLERLGAAPTKVLNNLQPSAVVQQEEKVTLVNNNLSKTLYIPSVMKKDPLTEKKAQIAAEVLKKKEEEESLIKEKKKKQEEARKEGLKLCADLRKRKQELLEKQLNQQKLLIQRLEEGTCTSEHKAKIMTTVKTLQDTIEKLRKDLASTVKPTVPKPKGILNKEHLDLVKKTREETQRELLDAELDLHNRQQEGKDTLELKRKVVELKMKAHSLGLTTATRGTPYVRGRGAVRARGRARGGRFSFSGVSYEHNVVDHRPTKLLVSGYEQDDKSDVLTHFAQFGEINNYVADDVTPSLILNFKSRKEAEVAMTKGRNFQDRLLSVTWASHSHNIRFVQDGAPCAQANEEHEENKLLTGISSKNHRSVTVMDDVMEESILEEGDDDEEIIGILSPDTLLQDEEDEDEEDRSWRR